MTTEYIVAGTEAEARREVRNPYSRMTRDTREEAEQLAARVNAEHGYEGYYRVWVDRIEEAKK